MDVTKSLKAAGLGTVGQPGDPSESSMKGKDVGLFTNSFFPFFPAPSICSYQYFHWIICQSTFKMNPFSHQLFYNLLSIYTV